MLKLSLSGGFGLDHRRRRRVERPRRTPEDLRDVLRPAHRAQHADPRHLAGLAGRAPRGGRPGSPRDGDCLAGEQGGSLWRHAEGGAGVPGGVVHPAGVGG